MTIDGLVSIIMPNYNGGEYISMAIESVISQTYPIWELIIIDDNSKDHSINIINEYIGKEKRIKLIKLSENNGAAIARNIGIEEAIGNYIAFLDSDDVWLNNKLEKQIIFMKNNDLAVTYSSYYIMDENGKVKGLRCVKKKISYEDLLKTNWIGNLTGIYDVQKIGKIYMENVRHEDYTLWLKIFKKVKKSYGLKEPLAKYRVKSKSYSSNKIKAIKWMWNIYRNIEKINLLRSIYYLIHYIYYGIRKRVI